MTSNTPETDEKIEFLHLLSILWKWRLLICSIIILSLISTSVFLFLSPKVYKSYMTIKPIQRQKNVADIEQLNLSGSDLLRRIQSNESETYILNSLNLTKEDFYQRRVFDAFYKKKINKIIVTVYDYKPDQGLKVLNKLIEHLNKIFEPDIYSLTSQVNAEIDQIKIDMQRYRNQLEELVSDKDHNEKDILKEKMVIADRRESYPKEIERTKERIRNIRLQKERVKKAYRELVGNSTKISDPFGYYNLVYLYESQLLKIENAEFELRAFLLQIDTRVSSDHNRFQKILNDKEYSLNKFLVTQNKIERLIRNSMLEIDRLQKYLANNKSAFTVVEPPASLPKHIKPNTKNIIAVVFILSFFVSVICAFLLEYSGSNKNKAV